MWNRPATPTPERSKTHPPVRQIQGKYDWRLWSRRKDKAAPGNDPSYPGLGVGAGIASTPDNLPAGLFASGSHGSAGAHSARSGTGQCNGAGDGVLLLTPNRGPVATPGSSVSSRSAAFLGTPHDGTFRLSRTTSVDSIFDDSQERCIHTAYRVTFQGDKRIKEKPYRIIIDGVSFVLVERVVSGHSDGVYQKSKKVWENVPRGQVRVFACVATTPLSSLLSSPVGSPAAAAAATATALACSPGNSGTGHRRDRRSVSPDASFGGGSFTATHTLVASLNGLRKFAHWGDTSSNIYNVNKEVPTMAVAVEKIDGESCHVTAFSFEGQRYWVVGLRDRHLLVRLGVPQEDVEAYREPDAPPPQSTVENESASTTATAAAAASPPPAPAAAATVSASARAFTKASMRVAVAWRALLQGNLSEEEVVSLHQEISEKQWTLCFDAIVMGCEHFVDYYAHATDDSNSSSSSAGDVGDTGEVRCPGDPEAGVNPLHSAGGASPMTDEFRASPIGTPTTDGAEGSAEASPKDDEALPLFFYAVTFHESSDRGLCLPVDEAMSFFQRYRLPTAARSEPLEVNSPEYDAYRARISCALDSAGCVFYGTNAQGLVVRLWKCRCYPYELERAAQEFIVTHRLHGSIFLAKFQKKLSGLSKEVRASATAWERHRIPFLNDFAEWLHSTRQLTPSTDLASLQVLRGHWVTAQHAFRHDRRMRGEETAGACGVGCHEDDSNNNDDEGNGGARGGGADSSSDEEMVPETVLLVGPQGCGKSTLARALYSLLEQAGCVPRWINQDEVGNRKAYLAAIRRATSAGIYTHIILDKMHLDDASRGDYNNLDLKIILVAAWSHAQGTEALVDVCFERVKRRGVSHRTFKASLDLEEREPPPQGSGAATVAVGKRDNDSADSAPSSPPPPLVAAAVSNANASPKPPPPHTPTTSAMNTSAGSSTTDSHVGNTDAQLRRMRGILSDCAERYEVPEAGSALVELEVTLNCNATVERVWGKLMERSIYDVPPLADLDVEEAFAVAFGYESLMRTYPRRITAVVLQANEPEELKEMVPGDILEGGGKKALEQVHVVLHNFSEEPSPVALVHYAALVGKLSVVNIRAVVSDAKATLLRIGDFHTGSGGGGGVGRGASSSGYSSFSKVPSHHQSPPAQGSRRGDGDCAAADSSDSSTSSSSQTPLLLMAVLAKAKKVTYRYCTQLLERAVLVEEPDPYIVVRPMPSGTCAAFTYHFVTQ